MVYVNGNWEDIRSIDEAIRVIREQIGDEFSQEVKGLYDALECKIEDLENEIYDLESEIDDLEGEIDDLNSEINDLRCGSAGGFE